MTVELAGLRSIAFETRLFEGVVSLTMQGEGGSVYVSVDLPNVERLVMSENALPACTNMTLGSGV